MNRVFCLIVAAISVLLTSCASRNDASVSLAALNPQPDLVYLGEETVLEFPASEIHRFRPWKLKGKPLLGLVAISVKSERDDPVHFDIWDYRPALEDMLLRTAFLNENSRQSISRAPGMHFLANSSDPRPDTGYEGFDLYYWVEDNEVIAGASCPPSMPCALRFGWREFIISTDVPRLALVNWRPLQAKILAYLESREIELTGLQREQVAADQEERLTRFLTHDGHQVYAFRIQGQPRNWVFDYFRSSSRLEWRESFMKLRLDFEYIHTKRNSPSEGAYRKDLHISLDAKAEIDPDPIEYQQAADVMAMWNPSLLAALNRSDFRILPSDVDGLTRIEIPNEDPFHSVLFQSDKIFFVETEEVGKIVDGRVLSPKTLFDCSFSPAEELACRHVFFHRGLAVSHHLPEGQLPAWREWKSKTQAFLEEQLPSSAVN